MAAAWAGIPPRTLYRLLRAYEKEIPCLRIGESQEQRWPRAHDGKRNRACFRYIIPAKAFMTWWETLGKPEPKSAVAPVRRQDDTAQIGKPGTE
jgi:hypothetical protein